MTDGVRANMKELTGALPVGCPWRALSDPFVIRVLAVMPFFESGQLAYIHPNPSHRLVSGVRHYSAVTNRIFNKQQDLERAQRDARSGSGVAPALPMRGGRRG